MPWLLDSREVAHLLGIGRTKAFQLMLRQELPIVRIGRCVRVPTDGLATWIASRTGALANDPGNRRA
ncbi:MAG: helix-turn-helix domain-containing protein [Chloroflexi bacterium]|nr:MAG: helix-turn-helix domain-containing protein [Chloroflexota bacterium]TMF35561.1 MAG: helix-turn-helix domain-containing protein [Chloroflexota bacterium]